MAPRGAALGPAADSTAPLRPLERGIDMAAAARHDRFHMGETGASERDLAVESCVRAMRTQLRRLLSKTSSRAELQTWALAQPDDFGVRGPPGLWGDASAVLESLVWADERDEEGEYLLGDPEFHAYLRWLCEGGAFLADQEPLVRLSIDILELGRELERPVIRWWCTGLGWIRSFEFCSPRTGRKFSALQHLEGPSKPCEIRKAATDENRAAALLDLRATLAEIVDEP